MVPELAICRCEKCSHGLVALKRSSELLSGRQQVEGASGQGNAFLSGKEPARVRSSAPSSSPSNPSWLGKESFTMTQFRFSILASAYRYPSFAML